MIHDARGHTLDVTNDCLMLNLHQYPIKSVDVFRSCFHNKSLWITILISNKCLVNISSSSSSFEKSFIITSLLKSNSGKCPPQKLTKKKVTNIPLIAAVQRVKISQIFQRLLAYILLNFFEKINTDYKSI